MGIHRLPNGRVSRPNAVACAACRAVALREGLVLSAQSYAAGNPLRTANPAVAALALGRRGKCVFILLLFAIAPLSISGAAKNRSAMQLAGYKAVRVRYGPLNKMIMSVRINGQPANLLVDTGSNQLILNAEAAESFGVRPSQRAQAVPRPTFQAFRYIRFTEIGGEVLPVGFVQNISAGGMNFGGSL